jgi:hypothetical protein
VSRRRRKLPRLARASLRALRGFASGVLALLILFEEWGWEPLQRGFEALSRSPPLRGLEGRIRALSPPGSLAVMTLPSAVLLPTKLVALWLLAEGRPGFAVVVLVAAKLVGTAIVARLFTLTRPALLRMPWFASLYGRWMVWKDALLRRLRRSAAWRAARSLKRAALRRWQRWRTRFTG